jgi:DedD protein
LGSFPLADDANLLKRRARRRLIGAIALVVLIVVVLPVVVDQQPRSVLQPLTVQIPSQDGGPFKTRVLPPLQSPPVAPRKADSTQAAKDPSNKATQTVPESASRPRAPKKESARTADGAKPRVAEARRAQALLNDEGFVVPLGAFTNPDNAKQVQERAASAGVKSYTENVKGQQGEQTRVRAGPFASRGAAEKARDKLKSLGLEVGQVAQR